MGQRHVQLEMDCEEAEWERESHLAKCLSTCRNKMKNRLCEIIGKPGKALKTLNLNLKLVTATRRVT